MKDTVWITLLSAVLSTLITTIGTVATAILVEWIRSRTALQKERLAYPDNYKPGSIGSKIRKFLNKRSIAIILIVLVGITVGIRALLLPQTMSTTISVFSAPFPFTSTGITVNAGDEVTISAEGNWNCGRKSSVGPEGYDEKYSNTVLPNAHVCALIGAVSPSRLTEEFDEYFLVGTHKTWVAEKTGTLYLGCNDSKPEFEGNPTDSKLEVMITVKH